MTASSSSWLTLGDIVGYILGLVGIFVTRYFYNKEKHTRLSCEILLYAYKFSLYYQDLISKVNSPSWFKGKKGSDLKAEIRVLCANANPFLPRLSFSQKQSLETKLTKVTDYITPFMSGTNESKDEMLKRMNDVDKYLQQLVENTRKGRLIEKFRKHSI